MISFCQRTNFLHQVFSPSDPKLKNLIKAAYPNSKHNLSYCLKAWVEQAHLLGVIARLTELNILSLDVVEAYTPMETLHIRLIDRTQGVEVHDRVLVAANPKRASNLCILNIAPYQGNCLILEILSPALMTGSLNNKFASSVSVQQLELECDPARLKALFSGSLTMLEFFFHQYAKEK